MAAPIQPVPLEKLIPPPELDGRSGVRRSLDRCHIEAADDLSALKCWIAAAESDPGAIARRLACERILNWAYIERGLALSSFEHEDFAQYLRFIASPTPLDRWIGPPRARRASSAWRPFSGPITPSGRRFAASMLRSMADYLRINRYADLDIEGGRRSWCDGFADTSVSTTAGKSLETAFIDLEEWQWVRRALVGEDPAESSLLDRLIVELSFYLSLHLNELAALTVGDAQAPDSSSPHWIVRLEGHSWRRGGEQLEAPPPLAQTLQRWQGEHAQSVSSGAGEAAPLVGMTKERIARTILRILRTAAQVAEAEGAAEVARRLRARTAKHLRHGFDYNREREGLSYMFNAYELDSIYQVRGQREGGRWSSYEQFWAPLTLPVPS